MPHISDAMARSLRVGWLETRDIATDATNFKNSFSSWDNCMAVTYCKWPVITVIIVGGLIVLSVIACIVRCACCGMSCCCECFSCLKCCGNCCGCCDSPRQRQHKHLDDDSYYPPPPSQSGYRSQGPMPLMTGAVSTVPEPPKYAQFETGPTGLAVEPKKVNDDALPPMPSWETATKKRVLTDEPESVEMGELDPATGQNVPLMSGAQAISQTASPHSPYDDRPTENGLLGSGTRGAGALAIGRRSPADSYGRSIPSERNEFNGAGNGRGYEPQGQTMSLAGGPARGQGFSPGPSQFTEDPEQGYFRPIKQDSFGRSVGVVAGVYPRGPDPYSPHERQFTNDPNRSPISAGVQQPYRHDSNSPYSDENPLVAYPPEPYQQNSSAHGPRRVASPAMTTTSSAFDFGSYGGTGNPNNTHGTAPGESSNMGFGISSGRQPSISGYSSYAPSTAPPSYMSRSPPPQEHRGGGGYPGYKTYQPGLQSRAPGQQGGW